MAEIKPQKIKVVILWSLILNVLNINLFSIIFKNSNLILIIYFSKKTLENDTFKASNVSWLVRYGRLSDPLTGRSAS